MICADTDIRLIVKSIAQRAIWADTDIRLTVKTTAQGVIWADTDIRLIVKAIAQSTIWADTYIRLVVKTAATSVRITEATTDTYTLMGHNYTTQVMSLVYVVIPEFWIILKVIYHPLYSMNNFVTNKSKLPQDGAQVLHYMGWLAITWEGHMI